MANEPVPIFYDGKPMLGPDAEIEQFVRRVLDHNHNTLVNGEVCWECRIRSLIFTTVRGQIFSSQGRLNVAIAHRQAGKAGHAR